MRKWIAMILALAMMVSLCGCADKAANAVDEKIQVIGTVSLNSGDAIEAARAAYDELSDKSKKNVENIELLESAESKFGELKYEDEYYELANRLLDIKYKCDYLCNNITYMWENIGASKFSTYFAAVCYINGALDKAVYTDVSGKGLARYSKENEMLWGAAKAIYPEALEDVQGIQAGFIDGDAAEATFDRCVEFTDVYYSIKDEMNDVAESVRVFKADYDNLYSDELETLNDWCVETSLYVDFALEPDGSLSSYSSQQAEFEDNINRYVKYADSYH